MPATIYFGLKKIIPVTIRHGGATCIFFKELLLELNLAWLLQTFNELGMSNGSVGEGFVLWTLFLSY